MEIWKGQQVEVWAKEVHFGKIRWASEIREWKNACERARKRGEAKPPKPKGVWQRGKVAIILIHGGVREPEEVASIEDPESVETCTVDVDLGWRVCRLTFGTSMAHQPDIRRQG